MRIPSPPTSSERSPRHFSYPIECLATTARIDGSRAPPSCGTTTANVIPALLPSQSPAIHILPCLRAIDQPANLIDQDDTEVPHSRGGGERIADQAEVEVDHVHRLRLVHARADAQQTADTHLIVFRLILQKFIIRKEIATRHTTVYCRAVFQR